MKKNHWVLLIATAGYSYLFYNQTAGINFLLFTLLVVLLLVLQTSKETMRQRSWQVTALASILTAGNVVLVNTTLAIVGNIISLLLLAGYSRAPSASVFMAATHVLYSVVVAAGKAMAAKLNAKEKQSSAVFSFTALGRQHIRMVGLPVLIFFVFLLLYRNSSAAFAHVLSYLDFSFISWSWVFFTFFGGWMLVGIFRPLLVEKLALIDETNPNLLLRTRRPFRNVPKKLALKYEYKTGFLLLTLLNLLILVFNLSDIYYLTLGKLPADISFSAYLHQGVNTLIFSILVAIGILLVIFQGNLNFYRQNKGLKVLAYLWLVQNLVLVAITLTKNTLYILELGLTYKRIGVYTYLTLTTIGLIFSFLKILQVKTNWFLFRRNAWAVYLILVIASCLNWDRMITTYNLRYSPKPDIEYLFRLSDSNLSVLFAYSMSPKNELTEDQKWQIMFWREHYLNKFAWQGGQPWYYSSWQSVYFNDWQSWNYNDWRIAQELK